MRILTYLGLLIVSHSAAYAEYPGSGKLHSGFLSTPQVSFTQGKLHLSQSELIARASEEHNEPETTEISYRYKLVIGDIAALGFLAAAPLADGNTAPFAVASYILASPLIHFFEPDSQEGVSKALWSMWYRLGLPALCAGVTTGAIYLITDKNSPGLLFAYALGLGTLLSGAYGLYKDYKSAVKIKQSGVCSVTATLYQDPASREVLMWQAMVAQSVRSTRVEVQ